MSKDVLMWFYALFINWFFVGVKEGERHEVRVYDADEWLDMPMSAFQEHMNSEFERLFRRNAAGLGEVASIEELFKDYSRFSLHHKWETPTGFIDELQVAMDKALKGGDWWLANKETAVVGCSLDHCPMEKKESDIVDWIFNWVAQAKQTNSVEWEEAVIPSRTVEAVVRANTSCDVCPYAIKEIGSSGCSVGETYSFEDIAEWNEDGEGKAFLNGLRIHYTELALFRQSMMGEREMMVWEIDPSSEEEFAIVNTPSGFIRMTFDEFVEHWNDLQDGVYNILMGVDEANETVDGYGEVMYSGDFDDAEVSLERLQEKEYEEAEEMYYAQKEGRDIEEEMEELVYEQF